MELADPVTGLRAEVTYQILAGRGVLRSWVRLANGGTEAVTVESATSFLAGCRARERNLRSPRWTCFGLTTTGWPRAGGSVARSATCFPT